MEKTAGTYRNLMEHTRRLLRAFFDLSQAHRGTHVHLRPTTDWTAWYNQLQMAELVVVIVIMNETMFMVLSSWRCLPGS